MEELSAFTKFIELLRVQPVLTLFLILGVGYLIGAIRIGTLKRGEFRRLGRDEVTALREGHPTLPRRKHSHRSKKPRRQSKHS